MSRVVSPPLRWLRLAGWAALIGGSLTWNLHEQDRRTTNLAARLEAFDDILDFSKIEAGMLALENVPFDPWTEIHRAIQTLVIPADAKGLVLSLEPASDLPPVILGDPTRMRHVVTNLVNNAIEFTEEGAVTVAVRHSAAAAQPRLTVTDTGVGIPADRRDALFEAFDQADSSTTREYGGTGLGLSICRQLVHLMGGEIGVDSVVGEGSTFWIEIPCVTVSGESLEDTATVDGDSGAGPFPRHMLLAEDDLVLMDCQMPVLDGLDAPRAMRGIPVG